MKLPCRVYAVSPIDINMQVAPYLLAWKERGVGSGMMPVHMGMGYVGQASLTFAQKHNAEMSFCFCEGAVS